MSTTSPTAAGHSKKNNSVRPSSEKSSNSKAPGTEHVDTINQVFTLFRVNFHNQYYAAFSDTQLLNQTKKLWLESLSRFSPAAILQGAKRVIEQSEYLPTLHKMIQCCQGDPKQLGLPEVREAYVEACRAPTPKAENEWSHPAVYFAGRDTDWFFLATNPEYITYPLFKERYQMWCQKVLAGETIPSIDVKRLPEDSETPLTKTENQQRLQGLRSELDL